MATYYIDQTNGNDGSADATNKATPWQTIEKALATLTAGDVGIVRNEGGSETWGASKQPANAGAMASPIILRADDGTEWADSSALTNTYTCINGSKAVTASATESELAVGEQVKFGSEDRWYTVAAVSGTAVTLEMAYRGVGGSGISGTELPAMPEVDAADSGYYWDHDQPFWQMERIHIFDGGSTSHGCVDCSAAACVWMGMRIIGGTGDVALTPAINNIYKRCYLEGDPSTRPAVSFLFSTSFDGTWMLFDDCLIAGGDAGFGGEGQKIRGLELRNVEITNATCAIESTANDEVNIIAYNLVFTAANFMATGYRGSNETTRIAVQDFDGAKRDNRIFTSLDPADNEAILRRATGTVRSGGGDSSIEVHSSSYLGTDAEWRKLLVHEAYLYLAAESNTITVYLNLPAANFTAAPVAGELWIEAEFLKDATNSGRQLIKSSGTVAADGTWDPLTVTFTPSAAGECFLRVWYCKTLEGGKSNDFFVDPEPVIS